VCSLPIDGVLTHVFVWRGTSRRRRASVTYRCRGQCSCCACSRHLRSSIQWFFQTISPRMTSRKSARTWLLRPQRAAFCGRVMLWLLRQSTQPVSVSLQNSVRFLRVPLPDSHITHLAMRLPRQRTSALEEVRFTTFRVMTHIG